MFDPCDNGVDIRVAYVVAVALEGGIFEVVAFGESGAVRCVSGDIEGRIEVGRCLGECVEVHEFSDRNIIYGGGLVCQQEPRSPLLYTRRGDNSRILLQNWPTSREEWSCTTYFYRASLCH